MDALSARGIVLAEPSLGERGAPPFGGPRPPAPSPKIRPRTGGPSSVPLPPLPDAPAIFPWLARRFSPGEATLWIGNEAYVARLLELLYAGSARARGRVSLIEGANRLHPYRVVEAGRSLGVDPVETMASLRVARAFTAYQLVALVDGWAREARRARPTLLVAHDLPGLFEGAELPEEERAPLLGHIASTLHEIAETTRLPMLLTLRRDPTDVAGLLDRGPRLFDVVRFRPRSGALRLEAYREAVTLSLVARPDGQRGLEEFDPGPAGEEVIGWDARPRRTGRRSRSG